MAMDVGAYFENVVVTFLLVLTFIIIVLIFLYMMYGREETTGAATAPKQPKPKA